MPILPLPQFEADLAEQDRELYERLKPPSSIVVRFGIMKMVGEFPYSGEAKPGCGSKMVVKTHRGTELGEMLTSTCANSGCSKSVTRQEMLEYIENSGGRDYPFFSMQGKVLRIATAEDLNEQARIDASRPQMTRQARAIAERMNLNMKVVDAEPILSGDKVTFYFASEDRIDFRELVAELATIHHARIELRQIGARDEARLTADYERCGQHCCCKQFLKVLKPVSMKSAKIQKATLDPLKISGRCGRLMCCLRYEDQSYDELRAKLPRKKSRVKTPEGWGTVLDGQILTQLVLVLMDGSNEQVAVAVEELEDPATAGPPPAQPPPPAFLPRPPMGGHTREIRAKKPGVAGAEKGAEVADEAEDGAMGSGDTPSASPSPAQQERSDRSDRSDRGDRGDRGDRRDGGDRRDPQDRQDREPRSGGGGGQGRDRGPRDGRGGPPQQAASPARSPARPPTPNTPLTPPTGSAASEADELLAGMETDFGDGRPSRPPQPTGTPGGGRQRGRGDGDGGGGNRRGGPDGRRGGGDPPRPAATPPAARPPTSSPTPDGPESVNDRNDDDEGGAGPESRGGDETGPSRRRRRRRRRGGGGGDGGGSGGGGSSGGGTPPPA